MTERRSDNVLEYVTIMAKKDRTLKRNQTRWQCVKRVVRRNVAGIMWKVLSNATNINYSVLTEKKETNVYQKTTQMHSKTESLRLDEFKVKKPVSL